jgi:hypothetical protein
MPPNQRFKPTVPPPAGPRLKLGVGLQTANRYNFVVRSGPTKEKVSCRPATSAFERTSKRRNGFPSEQRVKKGHRVVHGNKELFREAWSQRSMPVRFWEVISRTAACVPASLTVQAVITTSGNRRGRPPCRPFALQQPNQRFHPTSLSPLRVVRAAGEPGRYACGPSGFIFLVFSGQRHI